MINRQNLCLWILAVGAAGILVHPDLADVIGVSILIAAGIAVIWSK